MPAKPFAMYVFPSLNSICILFAKPFVQVRNTDLSCRASAASLLRALCTQARGQVQGAHTIVEDEEEDDEDDDGAGGNDDDVDADGSLVVPPSALAPQLPYTPCTDPNYLETFNGITTCQVRLTPLCRGLFCQKTNLLHRACCCPPCASRSVSKTTVSATKSCR